MALRWNAFFGWFLGLSLTGVWPAGTVEAQPYRPGAMRFEALYTGEPFFLTYWADPASIRITRATGDTVAISVQYLPATGEAILNRADGASVQLFDVEMAFSWIPLPFLPVIRPPGYTFRDDIRPNAAGTNTAAAPPVLPADIFGDTGLQRQGSITRGLIAGTRRDFAIESGLRFELSGNLAEDVSIYATLTDQSTPIQPDGSTQNIREFDQVLIRVNGPRYQVQMGDVDIGVKSGEFMQLRRRLQGASGAFASPLWQAQGGVAAPRGRFRTMQFNGQDGVQGPYRLTGDQGDPFIVVLAGSESVYIDGQPLKRGEEHDYIIDYGLGEIRFTSRRIITAFSRITVDFQYQNSEYARTLAVARGRAAFGPSGRWFSEAALMREADADDPAAGTFSEDDLAALRAAGNRRAVQVSGVRPAGSLEPEGTVLYAAVDTVIQGRSQRIYRASPGDPAGRFVIRFGRVEEGRGRYRRTGGALNAIVYEFAGDGGGEYDTLRTLRPPSSNQMAVVRTGYEGPEGRLVVEGAASLFQANRYATGASGASAGAYAADGEWTLTPAEGHSVTAGVKRRQTGREMVFFDRTLDIEFSRKWDASREVLDQQALETISEAFSSWKWKSHSGVDVRKGWYSRGPLQAERLETYGRVALNSRWSGWVRNEQIRRTTRSDSSKGQWTRTAGQLSGLVKAGRWQVQPQVYSEIEARTARNPEGNEGSFSFADVRPALRLSRGENLSGQFDLTFRTDRRAADGRVRPESNSRTYSTAWEFQGNGGYRLEASGAYRQRIFDRWFAANRNGTDTDGIFLKAAQNYRPARSPWQVQTLYDVSTERRARFQETYVEIGPELGQFVWTDLNDDGVQQIAEFFPEQTPNEGTFVKQWIPSDLLLPVVNLNGRVRLKFDASRSGNLRGTVWSRFLVESAAEIREHSTTSRLQDVYLLRFGTFRDSAVTLQGRWAIRNAVAYTASDRKSEVRFSDDRSEGLNNQTSGLERQQAALSRLDLRRAVSTHSALTAALIREVSSIRSASFGTRNFDMEGRRIEPGIQTGGWQGLQMHHVLFWADRFDKVTGARVRGRGVKSMTALQTRRGLAATLNLQFRDFQSRGEAAPSGTFEMTDGAGTGRSWLWSAQATYRFNAMMRGSFSYDGRTVYRAPAVHTVRFVLNAIF